MSFVLVVIYRPPSADNSFYENFEKLLKESNLDKEIIIMGDFNINWEDRHSRKKLKQITDRFDLKQVVRGRTRITNSSKTQIDLIFTNRPERIVKSFNLLTGVTSSASKTPGGSVTTRKLMFVQMDETDKVINACHFFTRLCTVRFTVQK